MYDFQNGRTPSFEGRGGLFINKYEPQNEIRLHLDIRSITIPYGVTANPASINGLLRPFPEKLTNSLFL